MSNKGNRTEITRRKYLGRSGSTLGGLAVLGGALTIGCDTSGGPAPSARRPVTVSLLTNETGSKVPIYQEGLAEFQRRNPAITVDFQPTRGGMVDQLTTLAASNSLPHLVLGAAEVFRRMVKDKQLFDITPVLRKLRVNMNDYVVVKNLVELDGKQYGMPFFQDVHTIYVNATMFDKAGLKLPAANWTWENLVETARALTRRADRQWGIWIRWNRYDLGWRHFYLSNLSNPNQFSPDGTKAVFDRPEAYEAVQYAVDLLYRHGVAPTADEQRELAAEGHSDVFQWGHAAMAIEGGRGPLQVPGRGVYEGTVAHIPLAPRTKKRWTALSGQPHWVTSSAASVAEEATMVAAWLGGEYTSNLAVDRKVYIPPFKASLKRPEFVAPPPRGVEVVAEAMTTYASAVPVILPPSAAQAINATNERIFTRELEVVGGLKEMQRLVDVEVARSA